MLLDCVRSFAPGFIFTTAIPPMIAAGALASVRHLKTGNAERECHQERAARLKRLLAQAGLPVKNTPSHIVPLMVGDSEAVQEGLGRATSPTPDLHSAHQLPDGTEGERATEDHAKSSPR